MESYTVERRFLVHKFHVLFTWLNIYEMKLRSRTRNKIIIKLENPTIDITQGTSRTSSGDKKDIQNYQLPDINLKEEGLADKKIVIKTENYQIQADNILEETNNEIKQEITKKPETLLNTIPGICI